MGSVGRSDGVRLAISNGSDFACDVKRVRRIGHFTPEQMAFETILTQLRQRQIAIEQIETYTRQEIVCKRVTNLRVERLPSERKPHPMSLRGSNHSVFPVWLKVSTAIYICFFITFTGETMEQPISCGSPTSDC